AWMRELPVVDYVEPAIYVTPDGAGYHSDSGGCSIPSGGSTSSSAGTSGWGGSYSRVSQYIDGTFYDDILPLNYIDMRIPEAWERSQGAGVTVGLIDTGVDHTQPELNEYFATGASTGRTKSYSSTTANYFVTPDWTDGCGHGTHMASVIAGPMNNHNIVGVAWRANLVSVRHDGDAVNTWDTGDTRQAIAKAGQAGSRIIAMAFQSSNWFSSISDEIQYWYSHGVLFVGAAGSTAFGLCHNSNQIVFPAEMPEVFGVTGANADGTLSCGSWYSWHVELAAVVEQPATGAPRVGNADVSRLGKSSGATAVVAGVAALVWARYPSWTRDQVWNRLVSSTSSKGAYKTQRTGYGIINAYGAVGGFWDLSFGGPSTVPPYGSATVTAYAYGDGPFTYLWDDGSTSPSVVVQVGENGLYVDRHLTVTDLSDGRTMTKQYRLHAYQDETGPGDCALDPMIPC
ncbi:MAG TPA: S8 family serine peptidase, partial [Longimicrobium sp.]